VRPDFEPVTDSIMHRVRAMVCSGISTSESDPVGLVRDVASKYCRRCGFQCNLLPM